MARSIFDNPEGFPSVFGSPKRGRGGGRSNFTRGKGKIRFEGGTVEEAVKNLRAIGEHVLEAAKVALKEGADLIVADAKSRCPVKTGKLRDSIKAVDVANGAAYEISAEAKNERGIPYGQFVEFDPRIARPFLYPAFDANVDTIRNNVKEAIQGATKHGNGAA